MTGQFRNLRRHAANSCALQVCNVCAQRRSFERRKFETFAETVGFQDHLASHRLNDFRANWLIERMGGGDRPLSGLRVLDIGCGGGWLAKHARRCPGDRHRYR